MNPDQEQLATALVSILLGGGMFSGIAALIKSLGERKQLQQVAAEKNIKTPAELGTLLAAGAGDLVAMAMSLATEAKADAAAAKADNKELRGRVDGLEEGMRNMRRANEAVQRYVAKLIAYIEALGHVPPEPDEDYRLRNDSRHEE